MTVSEGRTLKVGARVQWTDGARGTVREATYAAIKIAWDDGKWCLMQFAPDTIPGRQSTGPWENLSKVQHATAERPDDGGK